MKIKKYVTTSLLLLALVLAGCSGTGSADGGEKFTAASAKNTDSKINVELLKIMIDEKTDHEVEVVDDLPASAQIFAGIDREEFDFASLFSGEVYNNHFDDVEYTTDAEETLEKAKKLFGEEHDIKWYNPIGYTNNYSIAIKKELAEEKDINALSDLGNYANELILGTDNSWIERDNDGYEGFKDTYGYAFKDASGMDASLMYKGIDSGEIDVVTAYTVDPQLIEYDLEVIEDDEEFFPPYEGSLVARNEVVDEYPEINDIIESLEDSIDTEKMTELIHEVDIEEKSVTEVSQDFLEEIDLIE